MAEKKRNQGQRGATPKDICPKCGEYLQSCYIRGPVEEKRNMKKIGLCCPSLTCDYIIKDLVQLEDSEEEEDTDCTDKAEKIKKLTDEFIKKHEELNRLAEQIHELENE